MNLWPYLRRYKLWEYNIALIPALLDSFVANELQLSEAVRLKHRYKDLMFADPFILEVKGDRIEILAEELKYLFPAASLVKLTVSLKTFELLERKVILRNGSHFSFPNIIRKEDMVYILPENIASGSLNLYRYDVSRDCCVFDKKLLNIPASDPDIVYWNGSFWLFACKKGTDQQDLYLWKSEDIFGKYQPLDGILIKSNRRGSRMAGNFFEFNGKLYRPAQDCEGSYGAGIILQEVIALSENNYVEKEVAELYPVHVGYKDGIHTINFRSGWCVIDGLNKKSDSLRAVIRILYKKMKIID